ncbi:MAG: NAD(P)-dependent alcohol dehydrogenase, partial [Pseudomonadales bacterium]
LRDVGELKEGQKVLINGASGGVGTFAVQIAKAMGAEVTGVSSGRNHEMVRSLGADYMIDYTKENFTEGTKKFDLILDNVANHSLSALRSALTPNGKLVLVGGGGPHDGLWIGPLINPIKALIYSPFIDQKMVTMMGSLNAKDLRALNRLMEEGKMTPMIDRTYALEDAAEAIRYLETGRARAKVIVKVADGNSRKLTGLDRQSHIK